MSERKDLMVRHGNNNMLYFCSFDISDAARERILKERERLLQLGKV